MIISLENKKDLWTIRAVLKYHNKMKLGKAEKKRVVSFFGRLAELEIESNLNKLN